MTQKQMRDGSATYDRRLDRLAQFDERSRNYPIRTLIQADQPRSYSWGVESWYTVLDQGTEGACVGFAWANELATRPKVVREVNNPFALALYRRAQFLDEWPEPLGTVPDYDGTSVLAGAKAIQEQGYMPEYRWAFGPDDLALAVSRHGPAVLGINWYESMYSTSLVTLEGNGVKSKTAQHAVHVRGAVVGGHAILCVGYNVSFRCFLLHNSWGPSWGKGGRAWITYEDMTRLLNEGGEACVPVRR